MDNYQFAIEEMAISSSVVVSGSPSTVYRWARVINGILEREKYDWRVRADVKAGVMTAVCKEEA